MCSRYTYNKDEAKLRLRDKIEVFGCVPRGDIRPTDLGPVIIPEHEGFACRQMSWGWHVPWDKKPLINAKSETITQLPMFKPHLQNRCLILADGFFEKGIRFIQPGEPLFAMAGLWADDPHQNGNLLSASTKIPRSRERDAPRPSDGRGIQGEGIKLVQVRVDGEIQTNAERIKGEVSKQIARSFVLLTTTPNASVSPYHHRMPFILGAEQLGAWLGDEWLQVLENPDRALLGKIQKQAELF